MAEQTIFKRYEIKYMLTSSQAEELSKIMAEYMYADIHGRSTICNLYFDTPSFQLIRTSIEKPEYKEKFRIRSYGKAEDDTTVFAEIKKKYKKVVYKRRIEITEKQADEYFCKREGNIPSSQIKREMDYMFSFYNELKSRVFISYEREAFYAKDDYDFRVTFDRNILWRQTDLSLKAGAYGSPILKDVYVLMEVKTALSIPKWMRDFLDENKIYKTSFSKYGSAYETIVLNNNKEMKKYA